MGIIVIDYTNYNLKNYVSNWIGSYSLKLLYHHGIIIHGVKNGMKKKLLKRYIYKLLNLY